MTWVLAALGWVMRNPAVILAAAVLAIGVYVLHLRATNESLEAEAAQARHELLQARETMRALAEAAEAQMEAARRAREALDAELRQIDADAQTGDAPVAPVVRLYFERLCERAGNPPSCRN